MNTQIFPGQSGGKKSTYWSKPEGKIGIIFGLVLFTVIGKYLLPIVTTALENTIHFVIVALLASALFYILVVDRRIFTAAKYMYDWFIKKFFGLIFKLDPFLIAEDYINDIRKERDNLGTQITKISAQKEETKNIRIEQEREMQKQLDIAAAAMKKDMGPEMQNASRQANRCKEFANQLKPIEDNLGKVQTYLEAIFKNSEYMLEDLENDLKIKKSQYKAVTRGNTALKTALACMKGNPDKRLMMENSMEYLKEDMAQKLANMKHAIKQSSSVMKTIDLTNATMETEGMRLLEEYRPELFKYQPGAEPEAISYIKAESTKKITKYDNLID